MRRSEAGAKQQQQQQQQRGARQTPLLACLTADVSTTARKVVRSRAQSAEGYTARTVAARGEPYSSASSPKSWPGPSVPTTCGGGEEVRGEGERGWGCLLASAPSSSFLAPLPSLPPPRLPPDDDLELARLDDKAAVRLGVAL